ncbi:T3SS effector NleG family protein [Salmonella bongori]|uniref:Type III secretion protein n=3 Tax=Salmonella bongori TaxID=54736 RepID=A0A248KAS9_SALBN|nr:T3SS effector NleG family protein [Salmonella bongori]ASG55195.1 type III secretion protein [Salmonella bongori serovar 66:z41:- str. SA19983605]ASG55200.1 type III secretion protein [Salmonella bongori serovar 66:z41:- str. SA19983605]CCC30021.1 candidate type three secretion system effector protein (nleI/G family) [Salmonella bongori NCTC 12419]CCC30029.1 candidate type three secretion system effector protein (nleI/G family) [Salmonella bongori NCTC 12419]VDZ79623.1 type III secretion sys
MPLSFSSLSLNTFDGSGSIDTYTLDMLDSIRNEARPADGGTGSTEIQVQLSDVLYQVCHRPDKGLFNVVPLCEPGLDRFSCQVREGNAKKLAKELNISWKIDLCNFQVESGSFACSEEYLTCPITMAIPTNGIFVKASSRSDVCHLFDKEAFFNVLSLELRHPLSQEPIRSDMIVRKSECYFNTERDCFTLR